MIKRYDELCFICSRLATDTHHLIMGSQRKLADADGLCKPICRECHTRIHGDGMMERLSRIIGQEEYEAKLMSNGFTQEQARESFLKRYGRSYL